MLLETEILVGDIVELSPSKMSTLDDLDLEKCTVLEVDKPGKRIKVVFNNDNAENETFFAQQSTVKWFSMEHVIDIERDYKILKVTDNQDTVSNQFATVLTMAKLVKKARHTAEGYSLTSTVNEWDTELFIFVGIRYDDLAEYEGQTKRISFSNFKPEEVNMNGLIEKAWYANNRITGPEDVFVPD
jgi:hypothetical protein